MRPQHGSLSLRNEASTLDLAHMRAALGLAARGLGRVWPNPAVGCVVARPDGTIVGRGWTQPGGRPHAETEALARAAAGARGATAYVTLEPCAHHGETPPCAEALIAAGIVRAVIALEDPDPRVAGKGIAKLRDVGIGVEAGLLAAEAAELNRGFLLRVTSRRPLVALKLATSLDGRIATATGESRWITGDAARARGHRLRAEYDAIMVGEATAIADDPELTCRLPGLEDRSPVRVVVGGSRGLPATARLLRTARTLPTWLVCRKGAAAQPAVAAGVEPIEVADAGGRLDLAAALAALAERGITRLLVEGGGRLAAAFLAADLVDRIHWFRAPMVIGAEGVAAVGPLGRETLAAMPRFERIGSSPAGEDVMETYRRRA
jgi:diaminohydroxyphosphoribosylaminopyrimidine deaminase/5-amino-6-(5-phosphoribosylamino)uracil reductase